MSTLQTITWFSTWQTAKHTKIFSFGIQGEPVLNNNYLEISFCDDVEQRIFKKHVVRFGKGFFVLWSTYKDFGGTWGGEHLYVRSVLDVSGNRLYEVMRSKDSHYYFLDKASAAEMALFERKCRVTLRGGD